MLKNHLLPNMLAAVEDNDRDSLAELLTDAKALRRSELFDKYKRDKMRISPAKAALTHTNPGWELIITMTESQKGVILQRLGRRISYEP